MFMKTKINFHDHCIMSIFLSKTPYHIAFEIFKKGGSKMETNKQMMQMFLFGGTIGWSRTPMFHIGRSEKKSHVITSCGVMSPWKLWILVDTQ